MKPTATPASSTSGWESGWEWVQKYRWQLLFFLAAGIRLIGLNQSLWLDEAISARVAQQYSLLEIVQIFSPGDFHPPLYYLLLQVWSGLAGTSEIALRLPSVGAILAAGWGVRILAKRLGNDVQAWWTTAFFLCNPVLVYYSQEARMYALVVMLLTWNLVFLTAKWKRRWLPKFGFALTAMLSLWTFYGSVLWLAPLGLFLVWRRKWLPAGVLLGASLLAGIAVVPLLLRQLGNAQEALQVVPNWSMVLGQLDLKNLALIPIKLTSGRISFEPKLLYFGLAGLWLIWLSWWSALAMKKRPILLAALVAPITLAALLSIWTPMIQYFRFLYLVLPLSLALGLVIARQTRWAVVTLGGFLAWSLFTVLNPAQYREDWKSLAQFPELQQYPVAMVKSSQDPLRYYRDTPVLSLRQIIDEGSDEPTLVVLPYTAEIHGLNISEELPKLGYQLQDVRSVRGLSAQVWARPTTDGTIKPE